MANPFIKGWRYAMALFSHKLDEKADPKVLIQQALVAAQEQHASLVQQAAAVIGNQRQIQIKLARQVEDVEKYKSQAAQALILAQRARDKGDDTLAARYEADAVAFATHLAQAEKSMEDLKVLAEGAELASQQARKAVENNATILQTKLAERNQLLSQLEQAKMQESVASSLESMSSLTAGTSSGPSIDEVRDRIEQRYATAMGRTELAQNTPEARIFETEKSSMELAGQNRLEALRASLTKSLE